MLNRVVHDENLVAIAKQAGAEYLVGNSCAKPKKHCFSTRWKYLQAKVIVDAAGHKVQFDESTG